MLFLGCQFCGFPVEFDYFSSTAMVNFQKPVVAILEVNLLLSLNVNEVLDYLIAKVSTFLISLIEG